MHRQRVVQTVPLIERLDQVSQRLKEEAKKLRPGKERQEMLRKARQADRRQHHPMDFITWIKAAGIIFSAQERASTF